LDKEVFNGRQSNKTVHNKIRLLCFQNKWIKTIRWYFYCAR
jgi:hypothetical protein